MGGAMMGRAMMGRARMGRATIGWAMMGRAMMGHGTGFIMVHIGHCGSSEEIFAESAQYPWYQIKYGSVIVHPSIIHPSRHHPSSIIMAIHLSFDIHHCCCCRRRRRCRRRRHHRCEMLLWSWYDYISQHFRKRIYGPILGAWHANQHPLYSMILREASNDCSIDCC